MVSREISKKGSWRRGEFTLIFLFIIMSILVGGLLWSYGAFTLEGQTIKKEVAEPMAFEVYPVASNVIGNNETKNITSGNSTLEDAVESITSKHPELTFGVSYINLGDDNKLSIGGDRLFIAASTIKVMVASFFLEKVQNGVYTMDTPLGNNTASYHLEQMVRQSNNDSWALFNKLLGFTAEKNYAQKMGLKYVVNDNSITPDDMAVFLAKLYRGQLLDATNTKLLLGLMQNTYDERYIPGSEVKATFYHKTGKWEGAVHDAAIIDDGKNKYILVIYTEGNSSWDSRIPVFHEITEAVEGVL